MRNKSFKEYVFIKYYLTAFVLIAVTFISACDGDSMSTDKEFNVNKYKISDKVIDKVSEMKVLFGHQSVGGNIIEGINEILNDQQKEKVRIVNLKETNAINDLNIIHFYVGENEYPISKIKAFKEVMSTYSENKPDLAFFKFCYLDIDKNTNVEEVFSAYKDAITDLQQTYPDVKFAHITVPLTVNDSFVRGLVKKIIGRPDNNLMRKKFNEMLMKEYSENSPIFDLAKIESSYADGSRNQNSSGDDTYYALVNEYASDSGHLNEQGRAIVSYEFLEFLNNIDL